MRFFLVVFSSILIFQACNDGYGDESAIASYQGKSLYVSDIAKAFPTDISPEDSLLLLKKIVDNWLVRQLLYEKAQKHDIYDEKEIERRVDNFRKDLVIHQYKGQLLNEKIDTVVSMDQMQEYYEKHSTEFRLKSNVVRYHFVKLPKSVPEGYKVGRWMNDPDNDRLVDIQEFSYQNARYYEFDDKWVNVEHLNDFLPKHIDDQTRFLQRNRVHQQYDSLYIYFVRLNEYYLKGDIAPMPYIADKIRQIIIGKRRLEFMTKLENDLRREALNSNKIVINI
ncbi:MAG: hypothetical protein PF489_15330 [Salinivirgaceae bacterium]|jgi:hypothetical protein|nr:hypothetical protein [Salinivirgaceae bacterium]